MDNFKTLKNKVSSLTDEQIQAAYRYQEMLFNMDDAENHMRDYFFVRLSDKDVERNMEILKKEDPYMMLAERFIDEHDCEIADNNLWNNIVENYVEENAERLGLVTG